MYGINLIKVAGVLGAELGRHALFSRNGVINTIYQEIVKYAAQQNIHMVKVMMRTLAEQNEAAYNDVKKLLEEHFGEEEVEVIVPGEKKTNPV